MFFYGDDIFNHPAYIKTGIIVDTGVTVQIAGPPKWYHFRCETSIVIINCRGQSTGTMSPGRTMSGGIETGIHSKYDEMEKLVYGMNPRPLSILDVRTVEQMAAGCCPRGIVALILSGEYEL